MQNKRTLAKMQTENFIKNRLKISLKSSLNSSLYEINSAKSATQWEVSKNKDRYHNDSGLYGGYCSYDSILLL